MSVSILEKSSSSNQTSVRVLGPSQHISINMLDLWKYKELIALMVKREQLGQYKGSMLGVIWPVLNPLGHLLLYTFVFSVILKVRFGTDGSTANFAIYLMTGLTAWIALSESLTKSCTVILDMPNLVKRVVFPLEVLPLVNIISPAITALISFVIVIAGASMYTHSLHPTIVFLPLILASQLLFTGGLSWLYASVGVFIQDLRHFMSLGLSAWMYATPLIYPASAFPEKLRFLAWVNPMAGIITDYRRIIIEGQTPDWTAYAYYTIIGLFIWFVGYYFFAKTKHSFADVM